MKIITREQAVAHRHRSEDRTAGVYVLVDPVKRTVEYVGSTDCAEYRLYNHVGGCGRNRTPKEKWLYELKVKGLWPELHVVETFFAGQAADEKLARERHWIEHFHTLGAARLNVRLTPIGHLNSRDSWHKVREAEIRFLRARVAELEAELAFICGLA